MARSTCDGSREPDVQAGTTGCTDPFHIQHDQKGLSLYKPETEIDIIWKTSCPVSVQTAVRNLFLNSCNRIISQFCLFSDPIIHRSHCKFHSFSKSYDSRNVLCSCTTLSLLSPAVYKRTDLNSFSDIQETDSLWSVQLMSTGTEHINIHLIYVDRNLSKCLNCICME